jgi:hemoglobin-like flavoprotein
MPDYVRIFNSSLSRMEDAGAEKEELISWFYDKFLKSSPEVAAKLANTDMERQKEMLRDSFRHMLTFSTKRSSGAELERIAKRHSHGDLDIEPRLYTLWLDSLVAAVTELDPEFDSTVETAWRIVMTPGIEFMKGHYAEG